MFLREASLLGEANDHEAGFGIKSKANLGPGVRPGIRKPEEHAVEGKRAVPVGRAFERETAEVVHILFLRKRFEQGTVSIQCVLETDDRDFFRRRVHPDSVVQMYEILQHITQLINRRQFLLGSGTHEPVL